MTNDALFQIECPSCEAVFAVTDPELVGQIVACPKCGGMISIEKPNVKPLTEQNARDSNVDEATNASDSNADEATNTTGEKKVNFAQEKQEITEENSAKSEKKEALDNDANGQNADLASNAPPIVEHWAPPIAYRTNELTVDEAESEKNATNEETRSTETAKSSPSNRWNWGIATLFGVACALLVGVIFCLFLPKKDASDGERTDVIAQLDAENDGASEVDDANELPENSAELEEFALPIRDELPSATDNFDPQGVASLDDELNSETSDNSDFNDESALETSEIEAAEDGEPSGNAEMSETEGETPDSIESESDSEPIGDEETGLPTSFNEREFDEANNASNPDDSEPSEDEEDLGAVASTTELVPQNALPTLNIERKEADVDARLALRFKSIVFPKSPIAATRLISDFIDVPIVFDWNSFVLMRPSATCPLDLTLRDVAVGEALDKMAELLNWQVCKERGQIVLRPVGFDPEVVVEEQFELADLVGPAENTTNNESTSVDSLEKFWTPKNLTIDSVAVLVRSLIAPETWEENGGLGKLRAEGTTLIIGQTAENRRKTQILLEQLRALRLLEPETPAEELIPESLCWATTSKKISFNLLAPISLRDALEILEKTQKIQILWDDPALDEAGAGRDSTVSARIDDGTLDGALTELLEPLGLTYVALGENLMAITSKERAAKLMTVEVHFLSDSPEKKLSREEIETIVSELKRAVAPASWGNGEGNAVWMDEETSSLLVRQSQPNQRALRRWLEARTKSETNGSASPIEPSTPQIEEEK